MDWQGVRQWLRRGASALAALVLLGLLAGGGALAWTVLRPASPPPQVSATAHQALLWQAQLGVAGHAAAPPAGLVAPHSQAAHFSRYLASLAASVPGLRLLASRLVAVQAVHTVWAAGAGYTQFRVVDRRWFASAGQSTPISVISRGMVTIYLRQTPGGVAVIGLAYLPALAGAGSPAHPAYYPDTVTSDGYNPLGG